MRLRGGIHEAMLTIIRGTRNVARARGDLAASEVSAPMSRSVRSSSTRSDSNNKRYAGVPRVRGRVSVAVRRDTSAPIAPQPPNTEEAIAASTLYGKKNYLYAHYPNAFLEPVCVSAQPLLHMCRRVSAVPASCPTSHAYWRRC